VIRVCTRIRQQDLGRFDQVRTSLVSEQEFDRVHRSVLPWIMDQIVGQGQAYFIGGMSFSIKATCYI